MKDNYGWGNARAVKKLGKIADSVEKLEQKFQAYSDAELAAMTEQFKQRYNGGETLDSLLPEAFAVCREAAKRVLHQRHYRVQIMGGIALHQGRICQMATGEGKTLTETLPAYLNAIAGKGVHIVTVNEYLAQRDMEWMGKVFRFLGLNVGVNLSKMRTAEKQRAYNCDITYGTNNEFGFDYLRDNMVRSANYRVQRPLNFVIIDEVDSILIDEARTPLIISGMAEESTSKTEEDAARFVRTLKASTNVDEEGNVLGTDTGITGRLLRNNDEEQPNGDYVVDRKGKTVRLTETGLDKADRFFKKYLDGGSLSDPQNLELNHFINNALKAQFIMQNDVDYIVDRKRNEIIIVDSFTGRKMEGRRFNDGLHQAIEAKEGIKVRKENVTHATITFQNYFRMYRKMSGMTGTAKTEEQEFNQIYNVDVVCIPTNLPLIREDLPDLLFTTRKGKLIGIVKEIEQRHATGQPLLVGTISVEKSEELSALLKQKGIAHNVLNAKYHEMEANIIAQAGRVGAVTIATNMAGRGTDILLGGNAEFMAKQEMLRRGHTEEETELATSFIEGDATQQALKAEFEELHAKYKKETDAEHEKVVELGGLCVIGTERHDSRRIDNQLRGRAGRQGDPGTSVFFLSAEDDMLRIFGDDRLKRALGIMNLDEDEAVTSRMLSGLIEQAQKRIESRHFSARKRILQYDEVDSLQRTIIYDERNKILDGEDMHAKVLDMTDTYCRKALENACGGNEDVRRWDLDEVNATLAKYIPTEEEQILQLSDLTSARDVHKLLTEKCKAILNERSEKQSDDPEDIPFKELERVVMLNVIDELWIKELEGLDALRDGVGLQSLGQHDPVMVYKKEAYEMFMRLNEEIEYTVVWRLFFMRFRRVRVIAKKEQSEINPEKRPNGPCPCGSGKKYKNCCMPKDLAAQAQAEEQSETSEEAEEQPSRPLTKQEEYALKRKQRKEEKQRNRK